jgi:hypothetical protein
VIFSGETFKVFELLLFSLSATTAQLLSSGEFCKLRYDTIPVKSASAKVLYSWDRASLDIEVVYMTNKMRQYIPPLCKRFFLYR